MINTLCVILNRGDVMAKNISIPRSVRDEYESLIKELEVYDYEYYNEQAPSVNDSFYDRKYLEVQNIEARYPKIIKPYSPTQRVGGVVSSEFKKIRHDKPMLSLDKDNDVDILIKRFIHKYGLSCYELLAEYKLDGLTLVVTYENGVLVSAVTRGNGVEGEEVIHTARTIDNLPLRISDNRKVVVRGEVVISKVDFERINSDLEFDGKQTYSTARNLASGSLRQKDPKVASKRALMFQGYQLVNHEDFDFVSEVEALDYLKAVMFPVVDGYDVLVGKDAVRKYIKFITARRDKIEYDIDGLVFKVANYRLRETLGDGSKFPNWAMAFKFEDEKVETVLEDIVVQVSRTRRINPVAIIKPVELDGVTVSRATLNNFEFIKEMGLGIGDTIVVKRAGEVIPNVVESVTCSGNYVIPTKCPECGSALVRQDVYRYCSNKKCSGAMTWRIVHFASRDAMDIRGLSYAKIKHLLDEGIIKGIVGLYSIQNHKDKIIKMEGWGAQSYKNLYYAIDKSRTISPERFLYALGIPLLGFQSCCNLMDYVEGDILEIFNLDERALMNVKDFGEKTSRIVYRHLHSKYIQNIFDKLIYGGEIEFVDDSIELISESLKGYVFCLTGTLSKPRTEFADIILSHGGIVKNSLSKDVNFLVAGDSPGSKVDRARSMDIRVIDERLLKAMIEGDE